VHLDGVHFKSANTANFVIGEKKYILCIDCRLNNKFDSVARENTNKLT